MDYSNIPSCALFRHGTVIVRLRMEVPCGCSQAKGQPAMDYPGAVRRLPQCEQCSRNRTISRYSDCDSDLVDKCRPYRSSAARSRFVNVCAAVCLLLLVGNLLHQSSAAPHRSRAMDRQRRSSQEDQTWGNPCDMDGDIVPVEYSPANATRISRQALNALRQMTSYKDELANVLHGYTNYKDMVSQWLEYPWMLNWSRNTSWFSEKIVPKDLNEMDLNDLMKDIDNVLPSMYKGLKAVVASMYMISRELPQTGPNLTNSLQQKLIDSSHKLRLVLCEFDELMRSRKLKILPLLNEEIPSFEMKTRLEDATLVHRDAIYYLEYLTQIFDKMGKVPN